MVGVQGSLFPFSLVTEPPDKHPDMDGDTDKAVKQ